MQDTAKCPYCNVDLECDDIYDRMSGGECYIDLCVGHCPQCNKEFQWEEVYDRIGVDKVREEM
jgi:hypothetical protein